MPTELQYIYACASGADCHNLGMDQALKDFWKDPLEFVVAEAARLDAPLSEIMEEADVDMSSWRRWKRGAFQPSLRKFSEIIFALQRRADNPSNKDEHGRPDRAA